MNWVAVLLDVRAERGGDITNIRAAGEAVHPSSGTGGCREPPFLIPINYILPPTCLFLSASVHNCLVCVSLVN